MYYKSSNSCVCRMTLFNVPGNLVLVRTLKITVVAFVHNTLVLCFSVQFHISCLFCPTVTVVTKVPFFFVVKPDVLFKGIIVNAFKSTLPTQMFHSFMLGLLASPQKAHRCKSCSLSGWWAGLPWAGFEPSHPLSSQRQTFLWALNYFVAMTFSF